MAERAHPTWKCYWRPHRSSRRTFTARAAGRIMCSATRQGSNRAEILGWYEHFCPDVPREDDKLAMQNQAVAAAFGEAQDDMEAWSQAYDMWKLVNYLLTGMTVLLTLAKFTGVTRAVALPVSIGVRALRTQVATQMTVSISRRAANEAVFNMLRQQYRAAA